MKRILFVDDEENVLHGLRRMLHPLRDEWEAVFARSGREALAILATAAFDAVVTDMRMPEMNGAELLDEIRKRYPNLVRIVLSGQTDTASIVRSIDSVHQFLSKPTDPDTLTSTVERALAMRRLLTTDRLKRLVSRMAALPSLPSLYHQLIEELNAEDADIKSIERIISQDLSMSAKMLQMVNSAFFGLRQKVTNVGRAVFLLGLDTIKGLAMASHVFCSISQSRVKHFSLDELWRHSLAVGGGAKQLAVGESSESQTIDYAFAAGMLHDIGKLILASELPSQYRQVIELYENGEMTLPEAERTVLGATHAEIGAYLLGIWGLPDPILEGVAYHHAPANCRIAGFSSLLAVHIADAFAHQDSESRRRATPMDLQYLQGTGLIDRLPEWEAKLHSFAAATTTSD